MTNRKRTGSACRVRAAQDARRAMDKTGVTVKAFATACDASETQAHRWLDGTNGLPLDALYTLPPKARIALAGSLVSYGAPEHGADLALHASLARELTDVIATHAEALADGTITASEADELQREIDEAIGYLVVLRGVCDRADRERVIGVAKARPMHEQEATG